MIRDNHNPNPQPRRRKTDKVDDLRIDGLPPQAAEAARILLDACRLQARRAALEQAKKRAPARAHLRLVPKERSA